MIPSQLIKNKDGSRWDGFILIKNGVIKRYDFIWKIWLWIEDRVVYENLWLKCNLNSS